MPAPKGHLPYPGCETGGRPKRYTTEFIENEADALMKFLKEGKFLWFEKFAFERGYPDTKLSHFAKENDKFRQAYEMAMTKQKNLIIEGTLSKKLNHNMAALLLSHHWGMAQKMENKISGDLANPLSIIMDVVDGKSRDIVDEVNE